MINRFNYLHKWYHCHIEIDIKDNLLSIDTPSFEKSKNIIIFILTPKIPKFLYRYILQKSGILKFKIDINYTAINIFIFLYVKNRMIKNMEVWIVSGTPLNQCRIKRFITKDDNLKYEI